MKRYDEAPADFDKAIALNPNYAEAYYNRGNLLTSKGEMEEAQKALVTALELSLPAQSDARSDQYSEI